jgi:hypothetical protein
MATYEPEEAGRRLRALMSVAAAVCVLGLASLVWMHAPAQSDAASLAPFASSDQSAVSGESVTFSGTGVPSADSVFRGTSSPPEEPIAQF